MRRPYYLVALSCAAIACERVAASPEDLPPSAHPNDTSRFDDFVPSGRTPLRDQSGIGTSRSALLREGEVLVLEGDAGIVTAFGGGAYGVGDDNATEIVHRVLAELPDQFDTIQIFTTFEDAAQGGLAYYRPIANGVAGIGSEIFDGRGGFGLPPGGRLSGITNMNSMSLYGNFADLVHPFSSYHAVMAQELSHRWLLYLKFRTPAGPDSDALLGRDNAHYSQLAQAYASVQDGIEWRDNGDGTFTNVKNNSGFAPLDLYAMGVYGPEQVPPLFHIVDASMNGQPLMKTSQIPPGATVQGQKVEIRIDQVIAAMGPRNPPKGTETPYYRSAWVLVTTPGMARADWQPYLDATEGVRNSFPETWKTWTHGASSLCTKTTSLCPEPALGLDRFEIADGGDGVAAPKETVPVKVSIRNEGLGTAEAVTVSLFSRNPKVKVKTATLTVAAVEEGKVAEAPAPFEVEVGDVPCGTALSFIVEMVTKEGPRFRDTVDLVVGHDLVRLDPLDEAPDWRVDPDGTDSASAGGWAIGRPDFVSVFGVVTQPAADHTPGEGKLAFMTGPEKGPTFSSNDLDGGRTTLESPMFALGGAYDPTLVFYAWHVATDFSNAAGPMQVAAAALMVYGSSDGGANYKEIGAVRENTKAWTQVKINLKAAGLEKTDHMRFRFVITDPTQSGTVEAAIDDVGIDDVLAACLPKTEAPDPVDPTPTPKESCRCLSTGGSFGSLAVLLLVGLLRRRR